MIKNNLKIVIISLMLFPTLAFSQTYNNHNSGHGKPVFNDYLLIHNHKTEIALSSNQQSKIDAISKDERKKLIELKLQIRSLVWNYNQRYSQILNESQKITLEKLKNEKIKNFEKEMDCVLKERGLQ